jgi:hypothetical protein
MRMLLYQKNFSYKNGAVELEDFIKTDHATGC